MDAIYIKTTQAQHLDSKTMRPKMAANNSSNSSHNFFVDIHEVVSPKEESNNNNNPQVSNEFESKTSRSAQLQHPPKKLPKAVNRQVSLETGFSALRGDSNSRIADAAFLRSGVSFGGIDSSRAMGTDGRKGDFSMFRTKSSLSKQMSMLPVKKETDHEIDLRKTVSFGAGAAAQESTHKSVPAGRYFAALRGAELDQVKDSEDILLPKDELWPFLLRFPIGCFGICLGLSSQAVLWRNLAKSPATRFLHIPHTINLVLWLLAFVFLISISIIYALKCTCYFEAVRREYFHPVRVNFFFAPWIVCMFLAIGAPPLLFPKPLHPAIWCIFMIPVFFLELKIYGQWLSGGKRRLCKVANPSTHLSVVGNFIGAILAAKVGWTEPAKFLWAVGFAHYLVVFVTLYQRLPTSEALPKELHPVYSMFIAAPAAASIAWESIYHEFDGLSRTCYFIALFLYISLVVRLNFFLGFRFSVAWWAYTFPMTTVSVATIIYAEHVPCVLTKVLAIALSFMSSTIVSLLLVFTFLHAFIWQTLFPNDLAIAIAKKRTVGGSRRIERGKKTLKNLGDITNWTKHSYPSISSNTKDGLEGNNLDGEKIV